MRNATPLLLLLLLAAALPAQELRFVDAPWSHFRGACHDVARGRVVLTGQAADHWEWDGVRWTRRPTRAPNGLHELLYDTRRQQPLAIASDYLTPLRLWAFDGDTWQAVPQGPILPAPRSSMAMAFDSTRGELVLFGGADATGDLADTWRFTGAQWLPVATPAAPGGRGNAMFAHDPLRQRTVLHAGYSVQLGLLGDTWEWNGATWSQPVLSTSPPPRYSAGFTFDASRQQLVLVGGNDFVGLADQWVYDASGWSQLAGTPPGGTRLAPTLVFDAERGELLSLGGGNGFTFGNEVFRQVGTTWLPAPGFPVAPVSRVMPAVAVEPGGASAIHFGGMSGTWTGVQVHGDTWRWDGRGWTELPVAGPSARGGAVAWPQGSLNFLFGGTTGATSPPVYFGDLWAWNGTGWAPLPATGPAPRAYSAIAVDAFTGWAVLFGGQGAGYLGDTWTFDGTAWTQRFPATNPPPRATHGLASDLVRNRTVLVGGWTPNGPVQDTWEWDGIDWRQVVTPTLPPARGTAIYDLVSSRVRVLAYEANAQGVREPSLWAYDGLDWTTVPAVGVPPDAPSVPVDTPRLLAGPHLVPTAFDSYGVSQWLDRPARLVPYGAACTGGAPRLVGTGWPRPGEAGFGIEVLDAVPFLIALAGALAPAAQPVGGCTFLVQPNQALVFLTVPAGRVRAFQPLPLPNDPNLLGVSLYFQAAQQDPAAPAGFTLSAGLRVAIGD